MKNVLWYLLFIPFTVNSQTISAYNPSVLYDEPSGLYDQDSLRSIYINFYDENYHEILTQSFFDNPSHRILAKVNINGVIHDSVGVRYKGNSTFCMANDLNSEKLPLNLDMNHIVSGQKLMDYKKIKLANSWLDATFVREYIATQIYKNYVPTPESNLMKVYVQGEYLGVYLNTESINKQFAEKHFDENDGPLFKCDNAAVFCGDNEGINAFQPSLRWINADSATYYDTYDLKSPSGWAELLELMETLDANPSQLESVLNIDRVLWNFAVNTVICNFDTYNSYFVHNYYMYQSEDGRFQMLPWDFDNSFLNALLADNIDTPIGPAHPTHFNPHFGINPDLGRPLTAFLFTDPFYRKLYNAHIRTVLDEIDLDYIQSRVDAIQAIASEHVESDDNKLLPFSQFSENVDNDYAFWLFGGHGFGGIISTYTERRNYLLSHTEIMQPQPTIFTVSQSEGLIFAEVSDASEVELLATLSPYNSGFQNFEMVDDGTNGDVIANDAIYAAPLPFQPNSADINFYVRAQNENAMRLSPERAAYEFYIYSNGAPTNIIYSAAPEQILTVYPNPASDVVNIEYKADFQQFTLSTASGTVIESGSLTRGSTQLNISQLPNNIYFMRVGNEVRKIIKTD